MVDDREPPQIESLIIRFTEPERRDALQNLAFERGKFTDTISNPDYHPDRVQLVLVSFDGSSIAMVGLAWRSILKPVSFSFRLRFDNLGRLSGTLPITDLIERLLPGSVASTRTVIRLQAEWWRFVRTRLIQHDPSIRAHIERLESILDNFDFSGSERAAEVLAEEKDALGLAFDIFGTDRKAEFSKWREPDDRFSSFLDGIPDLLLPEDTALAHDWGIFEDWQLDKTTGSVRTFTKSGSEKRATKKLRVILTNRTKLESVLGVDLIYYMDSLKSFVLVQYKRMRRETSSNFIYRPFNDASYLAEYPKMEELERLSAGCDCAGLSDYRLSRSACFFKFITDDEFHPTSGELVNGRYVPLGYWRELLVDPITKGRADSRRVYYGNISRYLSNAGFTQLVRDGWVGTCGNTSTIIADLVEQLLQGKHAVLLAEETIVEKAKRTKKGSATA